MLEENNIEKKEKKEELESLESLNISDSDLIKIAVGLALICISLYLKGKKNEKII